MVVRLALRVLAVALLLSSTSASVVEAAPLRQEQDQPPPAEDEWWNWQNDVEIGQVFIASFIHQQFWNTRMQALATPGEAGQRLTRQIFDGPPLEGELAFQRDADALHEVQHVDVDLNWTVPYYTEDDIVFWTNYTDRSYMVDTRTNLKVERASDPPEEFHMAFRMRKVDDPAAPGGFVWKVVDSRRLVTPEEQPPD